MIYRALLLFTLTVALVGQLCPTGVVDANLVTSHSRIYIRHKREVEREGQPSKESTVVMQSNSSEPENQPGSVVRDFENEIATSEKDCKDFMEFDYNPANDSLFFTGHIPSLFREMGHPGRVNPFEALLHQMLSQTSKMFDNFPTHFDTSNNYPDNYNGTVEEEVTIDGQRFLKKQQIINKSTSGSKISIMSTVYVPVDEANTTRTDDLTDGKVISY